MKCDTFIYENTQPANLNQLINQYERSENHFYQLYSSYQDHLESVQLAPKWNVHNDEMQHIDQLASKTESALKSYQSIKVKLCKQYEAYCRRVKEKESLAKSYTHTIEEELTLDTAREYIQAAKELIIADQLVLAIKKILQGESCFDRIIIQTRKRWLRFHQLTMQELFETLPNII